jgi:hypothetical protein
MLPHHSAPPGGHRRNAGRQPLGIKHARFAPFHLNKNHNPAKTLVFNRFLLVKIHAR